MSDALERLRAWYEQRQRREQALLLAVVLVLLLLLWNYAVQIPMEQRVDQAERRIAELDNTLAQLADERDELVARQDEDPDAPWQERLEDAQAALAELEAELDEQMERLVSPNRMVSVLRRVLAEQEELELKYLKTGQPEVVFEDGDLRVYRHGVTAVFEGTYAATQAYLETLGAGSRELVWDRVDYQVLAHPRARVKLEVHTLSLEESTLGI